MGAAVLALSACGSSKDAATTTDTTSSSSSAAAATWANSLCGALVTWQTQIVTAGKSVTANPTKAGVQQALTSANTATKTLKTSLSGLGKPPTSVGSQAQAYLQDLKGQLQNDISVIERTVSTTTTLSAVPAAASTIKASVATMRTQLSGTAKQLRSLPNGELAEAIKSSSACQTLKANSPV